MPPQMTREQLLDYLNNDLEIRDGRVVGAFDRQSLSIEQVNLMLDVSMPLSIAILDPEMRYVFINSRMYTMHGITSDELKIGDHLSVAHKLLVEKGILSEAVIKGQGIGVERLTEVSAGTQRERVFQLLDGSYNRLTRLRLANGYTVSISEDITHLMTAQQLLQDALVIGESGYWIYDFDTKTYEVSNSLSLFLRPEQVEYVKANGPLAAIREEDRPAYREAVTNITKTGDRFENISRLAFIPTDVFLLSVGQIVRHTDGRPAQLQCFVRNVTKSERASREIEKAKDAAIAANVAKSQFLANMSHEIRTPMNGVLGMAELLAGSALDDRQREFVNVITRSATSLLTVINDILDFSKIEADALDLEISSFSLRDLIAEITTLLSQNAAEKGLELIVNYPSGQPHSFIGDGVRMRQILTNLVGNAIKFTEDGHVLIAVDATPDPSGNAYLKVDVTDTGIGIEEDKVDRVFEKFTQADNSTTRIYGGTGLGLSISKRLTEMMGGTLTVASTYGEGSTFTMGVPLPLDKSAKPVVRNTAPLKGRRALIVDDIDVNRRVLSEQLGGWGMKTLAVSDGVEALLALKEAQDPNSSHQPFDIVVLDYLMPGVNGRELASMIHAQPKLDVPVLMLSSCDRSQNASLDELTGVDRYLVKPVREQALFDMVLLMIYGAPASTQVPAPAKTPAPQAPAVEASVQSSSDTAPSAEPEQVVMDAREIADERAAPKIDILVAEDFPLNQDVVRLMLADTRYRPVMTANGQEAAALYAQSPAGRFAAVLMDVSMPVMDGYQATAAIAAIEAEHGRDHVPVIALTGHALTHEREKCLDAGMDDYLTKPVKQVELIAALDRWTGHQSRIAVA